MPLPHPPPPSRFSLAGLPHTRLERNASPTIAQPAEELLYDLPVLPDALARPAGCHRRRRQIHQSAAVTATATVALTSSSIDSSRTSVSRTSVLCAKKGPLFGFEEEEAPELAPLLSASCLPYPALRKTKPLNIPLPSHKLCSRHPSPAHSRSSWLSFSSSASSSTSSGSLFSSPESSAFSSPSTSPPSPSSPLSLKRASSNWSWLLPNATPNPTAEQLQDPQPSVEPCSCQFATPRPITKSVEVPLSETPLNFPVPPTRSSLPSGGKSKQLNFALTNIISYARSLHDAYVRAASFSVLSIDSPSDVQHNQDSGLDLPGYRASSTLVRSVFPPSTLQGLEDEHPSFPLHPGPPPFPSQSPLTPPPPTITRGRTPSRTRASTTHRLARIPIPPLASGPLRRGTATPKQSPLPSESPRPRIIRNPVYLRLLAAQHILSDYTATATTESPFITDDGPRIISILHSATANQVSRMCTGREKLIGWGIRSAAHPPSSTSFSLSRTHRTSRLCNVVSVS